MICEKDLTSFPAPGRKVLTFMVLPGAGKGDSITLLMKGYTKAAEIPLLLSTSSRICNKWKPNKLMENTPVLTGMDTARLQTYTLQNNTDRFHVVCFFFPFRFVCGSLWNSNLSLASHGFHRLHTGFFFLFKIDENTQFRFPLNIMITQGWIQNIFILLPHFPISGRWKWRK